MKRIQLLLFLLIVLVLSSCSNRKAEVAREFAQWIGREIVFPDSMTFVIVNDTVDIDLNSYDYKIVTYVDSTGCTPCRMKLQQWNEFIDEFKSIPDLDIEVLVVVNSSDTNNIHNILKSDNYLNPVTTDGKNTFAKSNDLPDKYEFQTFLVDAENKVVAVGNPVINPKIKELYKLMISDEGSKTDMYCKL